MNHTLPTFRRLALAIAATLAPAAQAADYNWSSGTFVSGVTAPNPLAAADSLNIVSGGFKYFDGPAFLFTNNGTVNWSTSNFIYMQNGASVVNNNIWDSSADHQLVNNGGATPNFTNNSIFRKSGGTGNVVIAGGLNFVNNGTLDAQSGSIVFNGGATFNSGSAFVGAGSNVIAGGSHGFNGSLSSFNLRLSNGSFNGNAAMLGGDGASLTGGTLGGNWTIGPSTALNVGAGAFKYVEGAVVNNGTVNWGTSNFWYLQNGGSFTNNSLFSASQNASMVHNGGAASTFTNSATGTLRAESGQTLTLGGTLGFINNGGTLNAATGAVISINGGASLNGGTYGGPGSVTIDGNNSFSGLLDTSNIVITNGTQTGSAAWIDGSLGWTGGTFSGTWTLYVGSIINAGSGAFKYLDGGSFFNIGTLAWNTTDHLYLQNGATFNNQDLFEANASTAVVNNGGAQSRFNNDDGATLRAAADTTLTFGIVLVNSGTLDAAAGATIAYSGGATFNHNTVFSGAGINSVNGSSAFNGLMRTANLLLTGGSYAGSNAALNGTTGWTGGLFTGAWTLNAASTLTAGTGAFKYLDAVTFTNKGTMVWNTSNLLYMQNGAMWVNNGLFVANADTAIVNNGGAQPVLDNRSTGILRAAGGSTLTLGNMLRNNGGRLDAETGSAIRYAGGAVFNSGTVFSGAGSNVVLGNSAFNGGINAGNLLLQGDAYTGGSAAISGTIGWTGGRFEGGWQLAAGSSMSVGTGSFKYISGTGTVFDNRGTIRWDTGNLLYLEDNARLQNSGMIDIVTDMQFVNNGGTPGFINAGLILKSGGTGAATIQNGLGFDNQGRIDVRSGTLALPTDFSNNGVLAGTAGYSVSGTMTNAAGGTVSPGPLPGTGNLALGGNYVQAAGANFAVDLESLAVHDLFNISGSAALDGRLSIHCFANCSLAVGDVVTILDSVGELSGSFAGGVFLHGFATGAFDLVYDRLNDRVQLMVTQAVTAVPEPASYALLLSGMGLLGFMAKRRSARPRLARDLERSPPHPR